MDSGITQNLIGKQIRLIKTNDPYTKLTKGDLGIVDSIDQHDKFNQVWIKWNTVALHRNTHMLALIPEAGDEFEVVK